MNKIVIWGCGGFANRFLNRFETLMQEDYSIIGYTGKDQDKEVFRGKKFYKPDELKNLDFNTILVLSGSSYEIKKEIIERFDIAYDVIIRTDVLLTLAERYHDKENEIDEEAYKEMMAESAKFAYTGKFINRSKGSNKLVIMLAGYKTYLYDAVFGRMERYMDPDFDVCIITSGKYDETVVGICEKNGWSYLSVERNNVSLVQNVAIKLHPNAEYIIKLDEDIFLTKGFFSKMIRAYEHAMNEGEYCPGIMAPILPVNTFTFMNVIKELHLENEYEKRFGKLKYQSAYSLSRPTNFNPDFAKFMWGEGGYVPDIDTLNEMFEKHEINEFPCPVRFNIGAILFTRKFWYQMKFFTVDEGNNFGLDEQQMTEFCVSSSQPLMISENVVVGHLGFGPQTPIMKEYLEQTGIQ